MRTLNNKVPPSDQKHKEQRTSKPRKEVQLTNGEDLPKIPKVLLKHPHKDL